MKHAHICKNMRKKFIGLNLNAKRKQKNIKLEVNLMKIAEVHIQLHIIISG